MKKKILPYVQSKFSVFQFTAIAPCPATTGPVKKILLHLSYRPGPFYTLKGPVMSPWIILFRLNNSNPLSLSS